MNHLNQTVGDGDPACWTSPGPEHEIECPAGMNFCIVDMEVDWMGKGDQYTTVKRSCAAAPAPTTCQSGDMGVYQYKDCIKSCSNNLLNACNGDLDVADMFPDTIQPVRSCFNCETHGPDDDTCGELAGPDASRKAWPCPQYANTGTDVIKPSKHCSRIIRMPLILLLLFLIF